MISDFPRRHFGTVSDDALANDYALTEIQDSLTEISLSLTLESLNLRVPSDMFVINNWCNYLSYRLITVFYLLPF